MIKFILATISIGLVTLWCGCASDSTPDKPIAASSDTIETITPADVVASLAAATESFEINLAKDTLIRCKKGTMILMPSQAFQFADGTSPTTPVKIEVKECYSLSEFIADSLTTTSHGKMLETGGMINIRATADGKELELKDKKEYAIYFPKGEGKKDMQLFYGERKQGGEMNWVAATPSPLPAENLLDQSLAECKFEVPGQTTLIGDAAVLWKLKNGQTLFKYFTENFKPDQKLKDYYCGTGIYLDFDLTIDANGKVNKIIPKSNTVSKEYAEPIYSFVKNMPPIDTASMGIFSTTQVYYLGVSAWSHVDADQYNQKFKTKYAAFRDKAITKVDKAELNYYVLTATKLGWINCDRFWNTPDEKINYFVKANSTNSKVQMVFADYKSIMDGHLDGDKFVFDNVPVNSKVKVICIDYSKDQPGLGTAEARISKQGLEVKTYKQFTLAQLESELNGAP